MDSLAEWKTYWWDVTATTFNWAVDIWPWQTVLFGVVIVAITTWVFWRLGKKDEVKNLAIDFLVSLVVSIVAFVLVVILVGPFLHSEGIKSKLTELEAVRTEKANFGTAIKELEAQRDDVTNQLKLSQEAMDIQNSEIGKLRRELGDTRKQVDDKNASMAEKVTRQAHSEKIAAFLDAGEAIKRKCFLGSDTPRKEAVEWHDQIVNYLKTTMDSSHVIRFKNTQAPNARSHYFLSDGKPVAKECNDNAQDIDKKLEVLKEFLSELSK